MPISNSNLLLFSVSQNFHLPVNNGFDLAHGLCQTHYSAHGPNNDSIEIHYWPVNEVGHFHSSTGRVTQDLSVVCPDAWCWRSGALISVLPQERSSFLSPRDILTSAAAELDTSSPARRQLRMRCGAEAGSPWSKLTHIQLWPVWKRRQEYGN